VTAGSGFLQSSIFDYFQSAASETDSADTSAQPAFVFCLQVTRSSQRNVLCAQSGGFIASGAVSNDKTPVLFLPKGLHAFGDEGFGEVQTPFYYQNVDTDDIHSVMGIGDCVVLRPAKAGEIAERFNEYHLCDTGTDASEYKLVKTVATYRGEGKAFY
jgi:hypothetical protein